MKITTTLPPPPEIEITDLRRLTTLVKARYGVDFTDYAMSSFKRRVLRIIELERLRSVDLLIKRLETDPTYLHKFVCEITVNVTEMFRDPSFWRVMRDKILPAILLNRSKINIWHAGCSSGEEVISMTILLREMGLLENVRIFATDLDPEILARARQGRFPLKQMELNGKNFVRVFNEARLDQYYTVSGDQAIFDPTLLSSVMFREHNLAQGEVFSRFDLILCRNVMIYFNQQLQNRVLQLFHESLLKYGYLAVGSKESLIWCDYASRFLVANNEEKVYKKIKD